MTFAMTTLVNGEPGDIIPTTDRGLLYGDGLFETIAIRESRLEFWQLHMERLNAGCARLGILPYEDSLLKAEAESLVHGVDQAVLKLIVTRGSGGRGYRVTGAGGHTRIMQLHPWPEYPATCSSKGVKTRFCDTRLGRNLALAGIKHLNRLEHVLARQEWHDEDIREGLLMDTDGNLVEGTMSNLFMVKDGVLVTPDLSSSGVAGIMRSMILRIAENQGLECRVVRVSQNALLQADEVFICNSLIGIWPVIAAGETSYDTGELTLKLREALANISSDSSGWHT